MKEGSSFDMLKVKIIVVAGIFWQLHGFFILFIIHFLTLANIVTGNKCSLII